MAKQTIKCAKSGEAFEVSSQDKNGTLAVEIGECVHLLKVENLAAGEGVLRLENRVVPYFIAKDGDKIFVWLEGRSHTFELENKSPKRGGASSGGAVSGDIKSPMPGTILQVKVKAGDAVEAGQALIIMESMKMEMTLSAPAAGTVKEVNAQPNTMVDLGALLVKLELTASE